jgi:hypothetical protein
MGKVLTKTATLREHVHALGNPQSEVILQRRCLDVAKAGYILRCNGDLVSDSLLERFDAGLRSGLEESLFGQMTDEGWLHATLGVDAGGLGMREASVIALLAFIASRTASRPLVAEMADHMSKAGICDVALVMNMFDERTKTAVDRWCLTLPPEVTEQVRRSVETAAHAASARWNSWCAGEEPAPDEIEEPRRPVGSRRPGAGVVPDLRTEDREHPAAPQGGGSMKLQRDLVRVTDAVVACGLVQRARASGAWDDEQRIFDLSDSKCSHE